MKLVEAIIQPHHLTAVLVALERVAVERLTVLDAQWFRETLEGDEGIAETSDEFRSMVLRSVILEIMVNDDFLDRTVEAISDAARSGLYGRYGDGKVLVVPVQEVICIASGQRGPSAV